MPSGRSIRVIGAGPAGSSAALAALQQGAQVAIYEKSRLPRHKVCGEFLSPESAPVLESLGVWDEFAAAGPATIRRLVLHFRKSEKRCRLAEPAFGLSRYSFDELLLRKAVGQGAVEFMQPGPDSEGQLTVIAHGRKVPSVRGGRLFGFKAHFEGPADDAIDLFFFDGCYVGVNGIEGGMTNVCGLGPESLLLSHNFDIDAVVNSSARLAARLRPLRRKFKWLTAGPLVFQHRFHSRFEPAEYPCGDALSFVDPFTGSGMLAALATGRLAGMAAAQALPVSDYIQDCRRLLERPFQFASLFRNLLANGWGERLSALVPGRMLVALTRPHRVAF